MTIEKYGASWCGPCKVLDKTLDEFCKKHPDIDVIKFDVDEVEAEILGDLKIAQIPVLRFVGAEDKEISRLVGAVTLTTIENELSKENA